MRPQRLRQSPLLISDLPEDVLKGLLDASQALRDAARPSAVRFRKRVNSAIRQLQLELQQRDDPGALRVTHSWVPVDNLLSHDFAQIAETNFVQFVARDCEVQPVQLNPSQLNASPRLVGFSVVWTSFFQAQW